MHSLFFTFCLQYFTLVAKKKLVPIISFGTNNPLKNIQKITISAWTENFNPFINWTVVII
jgi:hypothetical protein